MADSLAPGLSVREALDILFAQEDESGPAADTAFIAPPDSAVQSDEDSGDEDGGGLADNLNARQLQAEAEIRYNDDRENPVNFEAIPTNKRRTWYSGSFKACRPVFPNTSYDKYTDFSLIELFIDEDIIELLATESNCYALFVNAGNTSITPNEKRYFIAILILSGYNPLPNRWLNWDVQEDTRNTLVVNSMR